MDCRESARLERPGRVLDVSPFRFQPEDGELLSWRSMRVGAKTRAFDAYLAIDWSARTVITPAKPCPDALWVGECVAPEIMDATVVRETYWRTRHACREHLRTRLLHHVGNDRRVFIGFDFGYGYPQGFASALGLQGDAAPWLLVWKELDRLIEDRPDNRNNRFQVAAELNRRCGEASGPLWGCPKGRESPTLKMKSPEGGYPYVVRPGLAIDKWRWVDKLEPGIKPIWQLIGSGSVGGQCLVGIPTVHRLRRDPELSEISRVWPFETGFTPRPTPQRGPFVLHVEIWPTVAPDPLDPTIGIRDQAQVRAVVEWLRRVDDLGQMDKLFDAPQGASPEALHAASTEEGWIIGGGVNRPRRPTRRRGHPRPTPSTST